MSRKVAWLFVLLICIPAVPLVVYAHTASIPVESSEQDAVARRFIQQRENPTTLNSPVINGTTWSDTLKDDVGFSVMNDTAVISDTLVLSEIETLGYAYNGGIRALTEGSDGKIYMGSSGAYLSVYDPETGQISDLGAPVPGECFTCLRGITALVTVGDKIYGGTGNIGHLFVYDPDSGTSTDLGQALAGVNMIGSLTVLDGIIYGGTGEYSARVFSYDPVSEIVTDRGSPVLYQNEIIALTAGTDGKIYGGTKWSGYLFSYDPITTNFQIFGTDAPGGSIYALVTAPDGTIYGGSDGDYIEDEGYVFGYSPSTGLFTDYGHPGNDYVTRALAYGNDGMLYGGTRFGEAIFFSLDPDNGEVVNKGRAVWGSTRVEALTVANDGKIYGGGSQLFVYDPTDHPKRSPGLAISADIIPAITNLGKLINYEYDNLALTVGLDGKIYSSGGYGPYFWVYDPATGILTNLGDPGVGDIIHSLTTGTDGLIYGGAAWGGILFSYNPGSDIFTTIGQAVEGESYVYSLTTGPDGLIYGGTGDDEGHLFVYDPSTEIMTDLGAVNSDPNDNEVYALTTGADGLIYGATRWTGRIFSYDPGTTTFTDIYTSTITDKEFLSITTGGDGKIYAGTGVDAHLIAYDPDTGIATDLGAPIVNGKELSALTADDSMVYGAVWHGDDDRSILDFFTYNTKDGTVTKIGQPFPTEIYLYTYDLAVGLDGLVYGTTSYDHSYLFSYDPDFTFDWGTISFNSIVPESTDIQVDILGPDWSTLLTNVSSGQNISTIDSQENPYIKLIVGLTSSDPDITPQILDWQVNWDPTNLIYLPLILKY